MTPQQIKDIVPIDKVYEDALRPAMKQIGVALESVAKTSRFLLAPIEYLAMQNDRWQRHLKKVADKVSDSNLIAGSPQIVVPVLEGLSLAQEDSLLSELFINLLAASIDKTKQDLAHPSFPNILRQLSHDEAVLLFFYKKKIRIRRKQLDASSWKKLPDDPFVLIEQILNFPAHIQSYNQHLMGLSLIDFTASSIGLTSFGRLFADACVPTSYVDLDECKVWYGRNLTEKDIEYMSDVPPAE